MSIKSVTKVSLDNKNVISIGYKENNEQRQVKTKLDKDAADKVREYLNAIADLYEIHKIRYLSKQNLLTELRTEFFSDETPSKEPEFKALP